MSVSAPELIELDGDEVTVKTALSVREAAKSALDAGQTHYTDRPGIEPLRESVALRLAERSGIAVAPANEVLITCGDQEGLFVAMQTLAGAGDEVIVSGPALAADVALVRMVGASARISDPGPGLTVDPGSVHALINEHTRVLMLRAPTPTGQVLDEATLTELGRLIVEHDLKVIAVETTAALIAAGIEYRSLGMIDGLGPRTVTIGSFDGVGLSAWRVGHVAAQQGLMGPMRRLKQELSICSPAVSQYAALGAAADLDSYLAAIRDVLDVRRAALLEALEGSGLLHAAPVAGVHVAVWPRGLPVVTAIRAARQAGLAVADASSIGASGWLRLTLNAPADVLAEAAVLLAEALDQADSDRGAP
jgi:aspartate/methionine/tyrosine aminotransferase